MRPVRRRTLLVRCVFRDSACCTLLNICSSSWRSCSSSCSCISLSASSERAWRGGVAGALAAVKHMEAVKGHVNLSAATQLWSTVYPRTQPLRDLQRSHPPSQYHAHHISTAFRPQKLQHTVGLAARTLSSCSVMVYISSRAVLASSWALLASARTESSSACSCAPRERSDSSSACRRARKTSIPTPVTKAGAETRF